MDWTLIYEGGPRPYAGRDFLLAGGKPGYKCWDQGVYRDGKFKFYSDDEFPVEQGYFTHFCYVHLPNN